MNKSRFHSLPIYVESRISELKYKKKKNQLFYTILGTLLIMINFTTIILAGYGISLTFDGGQESISTVIASIAATIVIIIFVLNFINTIFRSLMRSKDYKDGMNAIRHEMIKFESKHPDYLTNNENELIKTIEKIVEDTIKNKRHISPWVLFRAFLGAGDV